MSEEQEPQKPQAPQTPPYRRPKVIVSAAVVLALVLGGGLLWWLHARKYESTDDAFIEGHVAKVAPQVAGRVARLLVSDNQDVEAGQLVIEIDPADYRAKLEQARAQQESAQAQLAQARAEAGIQEANVAQAIANVRVAEAESTKAGRDLRRFRSVSALAVAAQQTDSARAQAGVQSARLDASRQAVSAARSQLQAARAQIAASEAAMAVAAAQVSQAELQLSYARITAPFAGRVAKRTVEVGDYVNPGEALLSIVSHEIWIVANYKETQLTHMQRGQHVDVKVDTYPRVHFSGRLDSIQSGTGARFSALPAENATGNYVKVVQRVPVKIVFDDEAQLRRYLLAPGMSVVPKVRIR